MKNGSSTQVSTIQVLRFLAALLVVITHSTFYAYERLGGNGFVWGPGGSGVTIFFVISGFVMVVSSKRSWGMDDAWKKFILRRIIRIVPMYWLATTVKLAILLALPVFVLHAKFNLLHVVSSYLFIPTTNAFGEQKPFLGVGWTLYYEMFFYALFAVTLFFKKNVYVVLGCILCPIAAASLFREPGWPPILLYVSPVLLDFYLGMLIAYAILREIRIPKFLSIAVFVMSITTLLVPEIQTAIDFGHVVSGSVPAALLVYSAVSLEPYLNGRVPRPAIFFGDASYALYLFHPLVAPLIPTVLNKIGIHYFGLCVLLSICIAMCVGAFAHVFIERRITSEIKNYVGAF